MSRIGKKPVPIVAGAKVAVEGRTIKVEGPKGTLTFEHRPEIAVGLDEGGKHVVVMETKESRDSHVSRSDSRFGCQHD